MGKNEKEVKKLAFIQINVMSETLLRNVNINAVIPVDADLLQRSSDLTSLKDTKKYPALYLLHGIFGNQSDWVNMTVVQRVAEEKKSL